MVYKFTVPEMPVGKGRPRATVLRNGRINVYTPKKTRQFEQTVKDCYIQSIGQLIAEEGVAIRLTIIAFMPIPKSTPKKYIQAMLNGDIRPLKKPDIDNIAKTVLDALNGLAYKDDKQVAELVVKKAYDNVAHLDIEIRDIYKYY